jgi:hypothetical protein
MVANVNNVIAAGPSEHCEGKYQKLIDMPKPLRGWMGRCHYFPKVNGRLKQIGLKTAISQPTFQP